MRSSGGARELTRIYDRVPRTARSTDGFRRYREDYTQIVRGTLDAQCRKTCVREHKLPNFWTWLVFA